MKSVLSFIKEHRGPVFGVSLGLVIAILLLTIGFFPTLLITICVTLGYFIGSSKKFRDAIKTFFVALKNKITNRSER